jgi:hypothetical protein
MNKKDLYKNHDSSVNISALSGAMVGKRVLVVTDPIESLGYSEIRPFFDISIAVGELAAKYCISPDILIVSRDGPHVNGVLDLSLYEKFSSTILCITSKELSTLKQIGKYHSNYVMAWSPTAAEPGSAPVNMAGINYGMSAAEPGVHLALIGGATDIYSQYGMGAEFKDKITNLISDKTGYIPTNILRPRRPQFIEEARFH